MASSKKVRNKMRIDLNCLYIEKQLPQWANELFAEISILKAKVRDLEKEVRFVSPK